MRVVEDKEWPNDKNIVQHKKCCPKNLIVFKFDPKSSSMLQHIATGWPNVRNMLCPTMFQDVALKSIWKNSWRSKNRKIRAKVDS